MSGPRLIEPWLAPGSIALLFGTPSAGKTMLLTTLMHALARGEYLFERFQCSPCTVLVVQADMNNAMYQERLRASAAQSAANVLLLLTDATSFNVCDVSIADPLIVEARSHNPHIVFVDTLRKTHALEENASDSADRVYGAWRRLFPGAAFLFAHHTRKVSAQAVTEEAVTRESFRGNGAWAASADTLLMLRRLYGESWRTQLSFVRTRGCEEPEPVTLSLTPQLTLALSVTPESSLAAWLDHNPKATRAEAVKWLQDMGICSQATAYRVWDRVRNFSHDKNE